MLFPVRHAIFSLRYVLIYLFFWLMAAFLLVAGGWAGEVTFAEPRALGERGRDFCVGDFDGDGDPDLGVEKSGQYRYVYQNDGRKSPAYADTILWERDPGPFGDDPPRRHYAVDINGDGKDDWLICPPYIGGVVLNLSSGKKPVTFETFSIWPGSTALAGAPGDLNGDGKIDIVIFHDTSNYQELGISLLQNTGKEDQRFDKVPITNIESTIHGGYIHVADLNGDGANDFILQNASKGFWYENDGQSQPGFTKHEFSSNNERFSGHVTTADLNGDGHLDVIIGNKFLINDGEKTPLFQVGEYSTVTRSYITTGDLDGDGDIDMIAHNGYKTMKKMFWLENDGGAFPTFLLNEFHHLDTDFPDAQYYDVKIVDIDQDGDMDVIMAYTVVPEIVSDRTEKIFLFENLLKSPHDVGLFTPRKGDRFNIGQLMPVKWRSELDTSGPAVRFELFMGVVGGKVADLGQDENEEGQGWLNTPVPPHLPTRDDYRIRIVSLANEQYTAFGEAFTIIGNTAVSPAHFECYE